jgi:endonuclease-8
MPEGDTIFRTARTLERAIGGQQVTRFESVLPRLERVDYDTPLAGRTVEKIEPYGKWLLIYFSGDLILLTHMLMSGSWHIYRPGEAWQRPRSDMRIVIETAAMLAVAFRVPVAEFHTARTLARREGFNQLGPAPLADDFDPAAAIANLESRPEMELGLALLDQKLMAGLGNVFKSEVAFACGLNPFRRVGTLSRGQLQELVATSQKLLRANVAHTSGEHNVSLVPYRRTTGRAQLEENLYVYGRDGQPCRRCGAAVRSAKHRADGRVSFWCPVCQK